MTVILTELAIVLIGLAVTPVLFYHFPRLPGIKKTENSFPSVSVIIPARNEENNLPLLLEDLNKQTYPAYEIICIDDASEDATGKIALLYDATLISLNDKPEGWTGKSWACQRGADVATGELLLFLDADVRLGPDGLRKLMQKYSDCDCTISVQPYHKTEKAYEQLSMLFNLVQLAANGTAMSKPLSLGLYGPVILMSHSDYNKIGGHESVRKSIVEDMALGQQLKKEGLPYQLFIGDKDIYFRMYGNGLRSLLQGWVKNQAAGAAKTPLHLFLMVFFWITSLTSVPLHMIIFVSSGNMSWLAIYSLLYVVWISALSVLTRKVGNFRPWAIVFYPISVLVLIGVFTVSIFKKAFGLSVIWKGREIAVEDESCE